MAIYTGIVSSQIRKYAGYIPGGFLVPTSQPDLGSADVKQDPLAANYVSSNTYDKVLFISESTSVLPATINTASRAMAGYSNPPVAGYTLGGENATGATVYTKIEKLTFAGESNSVLGAVLSTPSFAFSGGNNGSVAGYTFGGYGTSATLNAINKLTFSNDTNSAIAAVMPVAKHNTVTVSNGPTAIYNAAGIADTNAITKLTLSNDTMSTLSTVLTHADQDRTQAVSNLGVAGYMLHRWISANTTTLSATSHKLLFSNETISTFSGNTSIATAFSASCGYSNIAGYFMGGISYYSTDIWNSTRRIQKLQYSTEAHSAISSVMSNYKRQSQGYSHTN